MNYAEKLNDPALDGQSAYIWRFDDAAECSEHMSANLQQPNGRSWETAPSWYGGESARKAADYAVSGNDRLVSLAQEFLDKIEHSGIETTRHEWEPSVVGAYPVVGDFLAGRPDCMRRRYERQGERAPVRVVVDTTSSAGIDAEQLQRRGAAILAFVMALAQERPVELYQVTSLDAYGHRKNYSALMTRCPTAPLNIGVCAHILTSQAWTRGIGYGWLREGAKAQGGWAWGNPPESKAEKARYARLSCAALDLSPQDVFVGAIVLNDPLTERPVEWINERLAELRGSMEE